MASGAPKRRNGAGSRQKPIDFEGSGVANFFWNFRNNGWMSWGRISREKGYNGWPGGIFLEKKARLDGLGAYFSRKKLGWMAWGRAFLEKG